jgi:hypothetical protein
VLEYVHQMHVIRDTSPAEWIRPLLGVPGRVGGTVPRGYEAYARVFHPAEGDVTWRQVAAAHSATWHAAMQWSALVGESQGEARIGDRFVDAPPQGALDIDTLAGLAGVLASHTSTPDDAFAAVWLGWGELNGSAPSVFFASSGGGVDVDVDAVLAELTEARRTAVDPQIAEAQAAGDVLTHWGGRDYVLLECAVTEFADPAWTEDSGLGWRGSVSGPTPQLLWPADRSWVLATEIDFDSTLIAGGRALIDALLADGRLEIAEVDEETSLQNDADTLNG